MRESESGSESQKINSLKVDLANFEEFGIKEQEFSEIFKHKPVYTLFRFGKYLYSSKILHDWKFMEMIEEIRY